MLQSLRPHTAIPFDAHLMVEDNDFFIERLAPIGVQMISVHAETATHCRDYLQSYDLDIPIQVDGNVSFEHIPNMVAVGADCLVGGTSSVFHRSASIVEECSSHAAVDR